MPVRIFNAADRPPAGMITVPDTVATLTSLLVTLTTVSTAAGALRSGTSRLGWPPSALYTRPTWGTGGSARPTGVETTSGTVPGGGVPTTTVSSRVSPAAANLNVATPWTPAARLIVALCVPAGIVTVPTTETTFALLLVAVTIVSLGTGAETSRTPIDDVPPTAV